MLRLRLLIILIVVVGSIELMGCRGDAARSAQTPHAHSTVTGLPKDARQASLSARHPRSLHRDGPHEAFLSTYNHPEEGISFRYPRNYSLEEGDVQEHSFFLKKQEDLDSEQPGATLLATVLIPEDGYPNTTFVHGSLQLVVNDAGAEKNCHETILAGSNAQSARSTMVQGFAFRWSEQGSATGGTKVLDRVYAGYSQGTCYEFFLTVAAEETADLEGFKKPADTAKIMRQLEKIVSRTQIFTKSVTPPVESSEESTDRL